MVLVSEGSTVFVYYSDNEKPEITIISPSEEDMLNGYVTVTGLITDEVGIQTFTTYIGNEDEVEIPLIAGNPYWSKTFDLRGEKSSVITFKAVDLSGNSADFKLRLKLDSDGDKPQLSLTDFSDDQYYEQGNVNIQGIASDDDGIKINTILCGWRGFYFHQYRGSFSFAIGQFGFWQAFNADKGYRFI